MATATCAMDLSISKNKSLLLDGGAVDLTLRSTELRSPRLLTVSPIDSSSSSSSISPQESVSTASLQQPVLCFPRSGSLPTMVQYVAAAAAQFSALRGMKPLSRRGSPKHAGSTKKIRTLSSSSSSTDFSRVSSLLPNQMRSSQRQGQKKSAVWQWFHHPQRQNGFVDEHHTKCKLCDTELAFNSSGTTTTMLNHLKSRHENQVNIEREMAQARAFRMQKKSIKCNLHNPSDVGSSAASENHNPLLQKDVAAPCLEKQHQELDTTSKVFHQHSNSNGTTISPLALEQLSVAIVHQPSSNKRNHLYVVTEPPCLTAQPLCPEEQEPLAKRARKRKTTPKQILPVESEPLQPSKVEAESEDEKKSQQVGIDRHQFLEAITTFLSKDLYSANIIQEEGMQSLLKTLAPKCALPCVSEVIEHLEKRAKVSRCRLASRLSLDRSMLTASVEVWNRRLETDASLPMATVTLHYMDNQFKGPLSVNLKTEPCMKSNGSLMKQVVGCCKTMDLRKDNELIIVTNEYARCKVEMLELAKDNEMAESQIVLLPCFLSVLDSIFFTLVKQPSLRAIFDTQSCQALSEQPAVQKWHVLRALMGTGTCLELQLIPLFESIENLALEVLSSRQTLSSALRCLRTQVFAANKEDEEAVALFKLTACHKLSEVYALEGRGAQILTVSEALCRPEPSSQTFITLCAELLRHGVPMDDANEQVALFLAKVASDEQKVSLNACWWSEHGTNWPDLSHLARRLLPLPTSCQRLSLLMESRRTNLVNGSILPIQLDAVDATLALHENLSFSY